MKLPVNYNNLTPQERRAVRERYIEEQQWKCYHCGGDLEMPPTKEILGMPISSNLFPEDFFKWPVHLHHSHDTGMTIGAVHARCNAVLWQYHGE